METALDHIHSLGEPLYCAGLEKTHLTEGNNIGKYVEFSEVL